MQMQLARAKATQQPPVGRARSCSRRRASSLQLRGSLGPLSYVRGGTYLVDSSIDRRRHVPELLATHGRAKLMVTPEKGDVAS
jgi:hypothetical protein